VYYLISDATARKLKEKHRVEEHEVVECFQNRTRHTLIDDREEHKTHPSTQWFIAETDAGRRLKVVFIQISRTEYVIRTAYSPDEIEEKMYERNT